MIVPTLDCERCGQIKDIVDSDFSCDQCDSPGALTQKLDFSSCPVCCSTQFYRRKDFNSGLGCLIVLIGAVFVPVTYGISLLLVAIIDWILYRRVPDSVVCYSCRGEYKGYSQIPAAIEPFDHHTAELYEEP